MTVSFSSILQFSVQSSNNLHTAILPKKMKEMQFQRKSGHVYDVHSGLPFSCICTDVGWLMERLLAVASNYIINNAMPFSFGTYQMQDVQNYDSIVWKHCIVSRSKCTDYETRKTDSEIAIIRTQKQTQMDPPIL